MMQTGACPLTDEHTARKATHSLMKLPEVDIPGQRGLISTDGSMGRTSAEEEAVDRIPPSCDLCRGFGRSAPAVARADHLYGVGRGPQGRCEWAVHTPGWPVKWGPTVHTQTAYVIAQNAADK